MPSGEEMFRADKSTRNDAFAFPNQNPGDLAAETDGDQEARVHPFPTSLAPGQKVGQPIPGESSPEPAIVRDPDREGKQPTAPQIVRD